MQPAPLANGRYVLDRSLGEGGMATVWFGQDTLLDVPRAVKVLAPAMARNETLRTRFLHEARTMAKLRHANIVTVFDVGMDQRRPYIIMEVLEGGSVVDYVHTYGPMRPSVAVRLIRGVLNGLGIAHAAGVVHRDVKPHNILLTIEGIPKLTDFGIAQADGRKSLTRTGMMMGTLAFMSPEQRSNPKGVDHRADLYSVGTTLYSMLTGDEPFDLYSTELREPRLQAVPDALAEILRKACALSADARYQSAEELDAALAAVEGELAEGLAAEAAWVMLLEQLGETSEKQTGPLPELPEGSQDTLMPVEDPQDAHTSAQGTMDLHSLPSGLTDTEPPRRSRMPMLLALLSVAVLTGGTTWWLAQPDAVVEEPKVVEPVAKPPPPRKAPAAVEVAEEPIEAEAPEPVEEEVEEEVTPALVSAPMVVAAPTEPAPEEATEPAAATVQAYINTKPWSDLSIDGVSKGTTGWKGSLAIGTHALSFTSQDGETITQTVTVKPGAPFRHCYDFAAQGPCARR
ncbi:MAG TPA: serine/threonine-protein kinase [Myxococcota bacterium]|nr:serine/threonine-protein kinase [Myxococcota bacterium]